MEFVNRIYSKGEKDFSYPFRVYLLPVEAGEQAQVIISVPKKLHKRAVARNYVRRRIRESIRLSREAFPFLDRYHLLIVYASSKKYDFAFINEHIQVLLTRISPESADEEDVE